MTKTYQFRQEKIALRTAKDRTRGVYKKQQDIAFILRNEHSHTLKR